MNTNIFIPAKINVGFQERKDTYTGKLAYVVYYDEKNKLRKEASWNSWRDKNIPNEIHANEPMDGFVLNKKVGGTEESYGWDARRTYTRVYDPRGFEFEITIPNLLWILENCNCIKGKGLEGQFVYGWDGKDLVLVPAESPDYQEIAKRNQIIFNNEFIKGSDLVIGYTYETLNGEQYVYMGKHNAFQELFNRYYQRGSWNSRSTAGWTSPLDETWFDDTIFGSKDVRYKFIDKGKAFWFIKLKDPNASRRRDEICHFKSISGKKFVKVVSTNCEKYSDYLDLMERSSEFSPVDFGKNAIIPVDYGDFENAINKHIASGRYSYFHFYVSDGVRLCERSLDYDKTKGKFYYYDESGAGSNTWLYDRRTKVYIESIEEFYNRFHPVYGEQYLKNGKLCNRRGYFGSEK